MVKRLVRWNVVMDFGEQIRHRYTYTVAIINQPQQIEIIRRKFLDHLAPVVDFNEICEIDYRSKGLHGVVFSFSSDFTIRDREEIYAEPGDFRPDRYLADRGEVAVSHYLERLALRS